ncbi:MAG TPA: PqqD family protein [Gemmatimonadales bacterium]|nr:PqqD family protein [Gemmatimonadales bacterium]
MTVAGNTARPVGRPDLRLRRVGSEWVLYDAAQDKAHVLNQTAAVIWTYCDGNFERSAIADAIAREVPGLDSTRIKDDIDDVLRRFADEGLLQ